MRSITPPDREPERPPSTTIRKEAQLREDQLESLTRLRRALADARTERSERISDRVLMRLAVDYLIQDAHKLKGNTEAELWESIRRRPKKSANSENGE